MEKACKANTGKKDTLSNREQSFDGHPEGYGGQTEMAHCKIALKGRTVTREFHLFSEYILPK